MSVAALVRRPGFRDLLAGQTISALGDWMGTIAFMALAREITGSAAAVGGILALRLIPAAVGGPLAARAAQRWDRRKTMMAMDLTRAAMIAAVPLVHRLWWIYVWAFFVEVASIVFLPARDAAIPDLAGEDDLPTANGLVLGSSYATIPLGAAAFAIVASLPGADAFGFQDALVFWLDAFTYVVSFFFVARLTMLAASPPASQVSAQPPARADTHARDRVEDADADATESSTEATGFLAAFRIPLVQAVMPAAAAVSIGLGALFSLGIVFVREVLGASDAEFGVMIAMFGVGAVIGLVFLQMWRDGDQLTKTRVGVLVIGIVISTFSLAPAVGFTFLGAVAFGAAAAFTLASGMGVLQSSLEGTERVVAFAAFHVVIRTGLALAAVGAGVAGDLVASVSWPVVGRLEPARLVLLCSGLLVCFSSGLVVNRKRERT